MGHHLYNLENLLTLLRNPTRLTGVYHLYATEANTRYYRKRPTTGVDVMKEDWDTLLLLDGCRYDMFEEQSELPGKLESRRSRGSDSHEFISANFTDRDLHDTVYVTSNPYVSSVSEGTFYAIENVLESDWDEDLRTVPPDAMASAVQDAHESYPNKRIIGHFMQPHFPFIGPTGRELSHGGILDRDVDSYHQEVHEDDRDSDLSIWYKLQFSLDGVTEEKVWRAYRENLDLVLSEIYNLIDTMEGKVVVSADHGNLIGDWIGPIPCRGYGHPRHLHADSLVTVPWLIIEAKSRRDVSAEEPLEVRGLDDETLEDRLAALGYA